jgi:prophage regulatory protein
MQEAPRRRVLRLPEVLQRTAKRRTSLLQAVRRGDFPRPIRLGPRAIGFVESEIEAWIDARMAERDEGGK